MCIVSFNRKTYCYSHFIDVKTEAWRCYALLGIWTQMVREREVRRMAIGSSFAGMHGWVAPSKAGTTGKEGKLGEGGEDFELLGGKDTVLSTSVSLVGITMPCFWGEGSC